MKRLLLLFALAATLHAARAQQIAVGTDVAMDLLMAPSIGAELVVGNKATVLLNVMGAVKPYGVDFKFIAVQPEYRYYFSGRPMHHWFAGVGGIGASGKLTWKSKVYDGMAIGGGLTCGYVFNLNKRLNIDCHAGFGAIYYSRKEYFVGDHYDQDMSVAGNQRPNAKGYYLLPTRIGVSLTYIIR